MIVDTDIPTAEPKKGLTAEEKKAFIVKEDIDVSMSSNPGIMSAFSTAKPPSVISTAKPPSVISTAKPPTVIELQDEKDPADKTPASAKKIRAQRSWVWSFAQKSGKTASCSKCNFTFKNPSTTSVSNHLRVKHRITKDNFKPKSGSSTIFMKVNSKTLTNLITNMVMQDMQPVSTVERPGFQSMISTLAPGVSIPSRHTLRLEGLYKGAEAKKLMYHKLSNVDTTVSFTQDGWLSRSGFSMESLTGQHVSRDFNLEFLPLALTEMEVRSTGKNLALLVAGECSKCSLTERQIPVTITTDSAANALCCSRELKETHMIATASFSCACHALNLVAKAGLKGKSFNKSNEEWVEGQDRKQRESEMKDSIILEAVAVCSDQADAEGGDVDDDDDEEADNEGDDEEDDSICDKELDKAIKEARRLGEIHPNIRAVDEDLAEAPKGCVGFPQESYQGRANTLEQHPRHAVSCVGAEILFKRDDENRKQGQHQKAERTSNIRELVGTYQGGSSGS